MHNTLRKTLIMHFKKHLAMSKDYYTKAEVQKLLDELKKEIIETLSPKKSSVKKAFKFNGLKGRAILDKRLGILHKYLIKNGLIEPVTKKNFAAAFTERVDLWKKEPPLKWIGEKNLCPFLLDQLDEGFYIDRENIDKKAKDVFGINNAAQLRLKYSYNKKGEPKNALKIKEIINALQIEQNNIYEEEALFKSIVLDGLEVESDDDRVVAHRAAYPGEIITNPYNTFKDESTKNNSEDSEAKS